MKFLILFSVAVLAINLSFANEETTAVAPKTALKWLKNGNKRYVNKTWRNDGKNQSDRERLKSAQHPHTILLSCADSRVPPELVFDQSLGEIFVIRVAGEALDSSVIASIEYAVEHLGTKNIVVMGHTSCGAIKATLGAKAGQSVGSPALDQLVSDIKPRLTTTKGRSIASLDVDKASEMNAVGVGADLIKRSKIIREKFESGHVLVTSAMYHLDTGKVDFIE